MYYAEQDWLFQCNNSKDTISCCYKGYNVYLINVDAKVFIFQSHCQFHALFTINFINLY